MSRPMFEHVALVGIGLIGSSISHAMRRKGLAGAISGSARTKSTTDAALQLGLIDRGFAIAAEAVKGAVVQFVFFDEVLLLKFEIGGSQELASDVTKSFERL